MYPFKKQLVVGCAKRSAAHHSKLVIVYKG